MKYIIQRKARLEQKFKKDYNDENKKNLLYAKEQKNILLENEGDKILLQSN